VIIISHKRSTLSDTDKLLVLESGRVKMFGPRDEVLQKLWTPQVVASQPPSTENPPSEMTVEKVAAES
jgi:ABC-type protease/lipase transport system fused ATPase/permease subunit